MNSNAKRSNILHYTLLLACGLATLLSANISAGAPAPGASAGEPLRVGITPEYPPLVFRQPEGTNGLEIDFANALGRELGRPIQFVVLRWDELIPALLERRTDIIMSGMSVTRARQLRIAFSNPYVQNELRAIFPRKNAPLFKTVEQLQATTNRLGVIAGSTGELYAKQHCPNAEIVPLTMRRDIGYYLVKGLKMDLFIDDTFALAEIVAQNEADLTYLQPPLSKEDLAWGVRPDDTEFLAAINSILERWKTDGTLERSLNKWIPYLKRMQSPQPASETSMR